MLRDWKPNDAVKRQVAYAFGVNYDSVDWSLLEWWDEYRNDCIVFRLPITHDNKVQVDGGWATQTRMSGEEILRLQPARTFNDDLLELVKAQHERHKRIERIERDACPCGAVPCTENDHLFWPR